MSCCCLGARHLVQQQKRCFRDGNFDLDLTYVSVPKMEKGNKRLIAMGFPATGIESFYRNKYEDVERMLTFYHKDRYRVYNLCKEKKHQYDKGCDFAGNSECLPIIDHNPTSLDQLSKIVYSMHRFLSSHKDNICAVHCKAGKGRTGTVLCCYILYTELGMSSPPEHYSEEQFLTIASDVMARYAHERSKNMKGVSIPSQRRYILYWAKLLYMIWGTRPVDTNTPITQQEVLSILKGPISRSVVLCSVSACGFRLQKNMHLAITLGFENNAADVVVSGSQQDDGTLGFPLNINRFGDVRMSFHRSSKVSKNNEICHFWIHLGFEQLSIIRLTTQDLDISKKNSTGNEIVMLYLS